MSDIDDTTKVPTLPRRAVLAGLGSLLLLPDARAEGTCTQPTCNPYNGYCVQRCTVGVPRGMIDFVAARQQESQWCWAACIQMSFAAHGFAVPQQVVVEQTFGSIVNMPGQPEQIVAALNREYVDLNGNRFMSFGDSFTVSPVTAIADLANRQPLIVGALGHATLLTAMTYDESNAGELSVIDATVRDPWPDNPSRRSLTPQEWFGINFAARIRCVSL